MSPAPNSDGENVGATWTANSNGGAGGASRNDFERPECATQRRRASVDEVPTRRRSVSVTTPGLSGPIHATLLSVTVIHRGLGFGSQYRMNKASEPVQPSE